MELEQFLCSLSQMTSGEKKQIIKPTLAVLKKTDTVLRHRDHGLCEQFNFYLPLIGQNVSNGVPMAIFSTKNASAVDLRWLVSWFKRFTVSVGDDVPVRVRRKETKEGEIKMYYSNAEYPLLPAYFTWDQLYTVMHNYVEEIALRSGATAAETEAFGEHTTAARRMREEYNVSNTPSQSYFLLLRNVNMFGVFYANKNIQYSDVQIVVPAGFQKLTFYADNCGGQTKNNFVVRMLLTLGTYVAFG
ncbi:hypothetical protein L916_21346 [Phytophthora nicotianae]|uniref:Uncharacterized protein n=1 Tax=Phytophthora nicotianae TaxID=4792 RepID=W2HU34_PHYNI|nr:hypothetical protein L916_21346 [Phytophthora nicotianae]